MQRQLWVRQRIRSREEVTVNSMFRLQCEMMSELLRYPKSEFMLVLSQLLEIVRDQKEPFESLSRFHDDVSLMSTSELQELYTRTFDLSPVCSPALSVHLFGVESFKRSHLMVGLIDTYAQAGFEYRGEAADHMATLFGFLPFASPMEREEIVGFIVRPALGKMANLLGSKLNPYTHLLCAASAITLKTPAVELHNA